MPTGIQVKTKETDTLCMQTGGQRHYACRQGYSDTAHAERETETEAGTDTYTRRDRHTR